MAFSLCAFYTAWNCSFMLPSVCFCPSLTLVSLWPQRADWCKEGTGEAGLQRSDVLEDVLAPAPPFAHFLRQWPRVVRLLLCLCKTSEKIWSNWNSSGLADFHLKGRPIIDFSERITYLLQHKIHSSCLLSEVLFSVCFLKIIVASQKIWWVSINCIHFLSREINSISVIAFFFHFCGL